MPSGAIITTLGLAKLASATPLNQLNISTLAVGDGNGGYPTLDPSMTSLTNEVWRGTPSPPIRDPNSPNVLIFEAVIPPNVGGFTVREQAIFDDAGDMIAIGQTSIVEKPLPNEATGVILTVRLHIQLDNAGQVDLFFQDDPTISAGNVSNANGGSVQDFIDAQYTTVTELATGKFQVGQYVRLTDRAMGLFLVQSGGTADNYGVLNAGNGNTAEIDKGQEINIEMYGASDDPSSDQSFNAMAIQKCWNENKNSTMPAKKFKFNSQLKYVQENGWSFSGVNENSILEYTGPDSDWAISSPVTSDGFGGVFGVSLKDFTLQGPSGTRTKKLLDCIFTRYSYFKGLFLKDALITMRHAVNWGNRFEKCTFAPEYANPAPVFSSVAIWLANVGAATNVSNATTFSNCRIEGANDGVLNEGGGRGVLFCDETIFEQNNKHVSFRGVSATRQFVIDGCYMELANIVPLYMDMASLAGDFDGIQLINSTITDGGGLASILWLDGVTSSSSVRISIRNNTIEFPSILNIPSTGLALYTPDGSQNVIIEYETPFQPTKGDGVSLNFRHYDHNTVNIAFLSTNVPFPLTYANGSDGNPFAPVHQLAKLYATPKNGVITIEGSAVNSNNVTTSVQPVANIPITARPPYVFVGGYSKGVSPFTEYCDISGGTLNVYNIAGLAGSFNLRYRVSEMVV